MFAAFFYHADTKNYAALAVDRFSCIGRGKGPGGTCRRGKCPTPKYNGMLFVTGRFQWQRRHIKAMFWIGCLTCSCLFIDYKYANFVLKPEYAKQYSKTKLFRIFRLQKFKLLAKT